MQGLLKSGEVAETLGLSVRTLEAYRSKGGGPPYIKIRGAVRYDADDLSKWLRAQRRNSTSEVSQQVGRAGR